MGRQISFLHTEADIGPFLREAEALGGRIRCQDKLYLPTELEAAILEKMASYQCQFHLIPAEAPDAPAVEFSNCTKGNSLSRTYEVGRLYLDTTACDSRALALFEKLRGYIRKNYLYGRSSAVYFSPAFKTQYDRKYYFGIRGSVQPVHF